MLFYSFFSPIGDLSAWGLGDGVSTRHHKK